MYKPGADLVVLDEGHRIRHWEAQITKSISHIETKKRIILSGYPFQNNLIEYYTMINWARPDHLGELQGFKMLFEKPINEGKHQTATDLKKQIGIF